jgi:uncharacterized protein
VERVATVEVLGRYPVKSMRGEEVAAAPVTWNGLLGDRRHAFVRADTGASFPWLTGRQDGAYILYEPRFETPPTEEAPEPPLWVRTPEDEVYAIADPRLRALLEARFGHPLFLLHQGRGCFDSAHLSLVGLPTLDRLGAEVGRPLERQRFRANLYLAPVDGEPFTEDAWVGQVLQVGERVRLAVTKRNVRCVMTTLDPATAEANPAVLRTIVQQHEQCVGLHAAVLTTGTIRQGDPVYRVG